MMMFPKWPTDPAHCIKDGQTYYDPEAIPEELRTKKDREDDKDGGFQEIEPIITLRRAYLGVYAEIVRISYWITCKEDGGVFYQVNLVSPSNLGFSRDQRGTVSVGCRPGAMFNEFDAVMELLDDARKFVQWSLDD